MYLFRYKSCLECTILSPNYDVTTYIDPKQLGYYMVCGLTLVRKLFEGQDNRVKINAYNLFHFILQENTYKHFDISNFRVSLLILKILICLLVFGLLVHRTNAKIYMYISNKSSNIG